VFKQFKVGSDYAVRDGRVAHISERRLNVGTLDVNYVGTIDDKECYWDAWGKDVYGQENNDLMEVTC
jgi:hypothetical protein